MSHYTHGLQDLVSGSPEDENISGNILHLKIWHSAVYNSAFRIRRSAQRVFLQFSLTKWSKGLRLPTFLDAQRKNLLTQNGSNGHR